MLGLAGCLFYRTLTHAQDFTGETQLAVVHTHLLALGMVVMLVLLALEKVFQLSAHKSFNVYIWLYNIHAVITVGIQTTFRTMTVHERSKPDTPTMTRISYLGHMFFPAALISLLLALGARVSSSQKDTLKDKPANA